MVFTMVAWIFSAIMVLLFCSRRIWGPVSYTHLRKANLTIALEDKPGQLKKVAEVVSRCGSNVVSVQHDGSDPNMPISSCFLKLTLETRDAAQIEQIRTELTKAGFQLVSERV